MDAKNDVNVLDYCKVLEKLKFQEDENEDPHSLGSRINSNVCCLQTFNTEPFSRVFLQNAEQLKVTIEGCDWKSKDLSNTYCVYLQHVLLQIVDNTDFNSENKEDLISTKHINLIIAAIQDLSLLDLRHRTTCIFPKLATVVNSKSEQFNKPLNSDMLRCSLAFIEKMLAIKTFHIANSMEAVIRDFMSVIFSLLTAQNFKLSSELLQQKLNYIWLTNKIEYFRNLMMFKSYAELPTSLKKKLHQELLQKLASKDGFTTFVAVLHTAAQKRQDVTIQQNAEIIANIVAFPGHSQRYQTVMIKQIFSFLNLCLKHDSMLDSMSAGLLTLRRLYDLNEENRTLIAELVYMPLKKFSQPEDVISGLIIMEHIEFCQLITLLYQLFYASSVECLPSELLISYLPMLFELYYNLPDELVPKQQLAVIVARCLNNRKLDELQDIIFKLYTRNFNTNWQKLHKRIVLIPNSAQNEISVKIASADYKTDFSISLSLPMLLMQSNHAILTYQIFMALLEMMSSMLLANDDSELDVNLLDSEEELIALLNAKYPVKIEIVLSLNELISYQPLKSQIAENSQEFLKFLRRLVEQRIYRQNCTQNSEATDQILLIMLTLTQEFLMCSQLPEEQRDFVPALKRLRELSPNFLVQQRIDTLLTLISGNMKINAVVNDAAFNTARSLLESHESHLQVYGIQMLLDLLRKHDEMTLANVHVVIALALTTLKHKESYTFLNCVRLFVALVNVMESEVLEILSDEYLNDQSDLDFRLVVGEAILKTTQELGPLCYKHKDILLNIFMLGARSNINEFRMSSFANLAQLCRILCYQVLKFFQELIQLIDCELSTGKYLPAKRAALLVLSELLEGIDNLMDFEEMLLPVYRLLKLIAQTENCDEQMRTHATNGLKALAEKCKKFLFPEELLRKEIRIFGIKDDNKTNHKSGKHILEIN